MWLKHSAFIMLRAAGQTNCQRNDSPESDGRCSTEYSKLSFGTLLLEPDHSMLDFLALWKYSGSD